MHARMLHRCYGWDDIRNRSVPRAPEADSKSEVVASEMELFSAATIHPFIRIPLSKICHHSTPMEMPIKARVNRKYG